MQNPDVVVIGAGMAGLSYASAAAQAGRRVLVIEKSRGTGGRMASKRVKDTAGDYVGYDLGAPDFRANDIGFVARLEALQQAGASAYTAAGTWVGASRNSALTRALADGLDIRFERRVTYLEKRQQGWRVHAESSSNPLDLQRIEAASVVIASPPAQAAALVQHDAALCRSLSAARIEPQWTVMIATSRPTVAADEAARLAALTAVGAGVSRVSLESAKRGAPEEDRAIWQLHFGTDWSWRHVDMQPDAVKQHALNCWQHCFTKEKPIASHAHRWLYSVCGRSSRPELPESIARNSDKGCYYDAQQRLGLCGDYWLASGSADGVESAYQSGQALARRMA